MIFQSLRLVSSGLCSLQLMFFLRVTNLKWDFQNEKGLGYNVTNYLKNRTSESSAVSVKLKKGFSTF